MYDKPYINRSKYSWAWTASSTAGGGSVQEFAIRGLKGKAGLIWDYGIEGVTTTLTSAASVAIGTTADPDAYGEEFDISAVAAEDAKSVRQTYNLVSVSTNSTDFRDFAIATIPADTKVLVTVTDSSDGVGTVFAIIDWMD